MHQQPLSGLLQHASVTLLKAGATQGKDELVREIAKIKQELPDNNIAPWVQGHFSVVLVANRHHFDILEEVEQIRAVL